jgi:hypothetical protein
MKTLMSYLAVFALILTSSFTINSQQQLNEKNGTGCFNHIRVHRQGKNVVAAWAVTTKDIAGFSVERSYDGDFFEEAGSVDADGGSSYKYTDIGVFPGLIYYRVKAVHTDGTTEYSPVETIRIMQRG